MPGTGGNKIIASVSCTPLPVRYAIYTQCVSHRGGVQLNGNVILDFVQEAHIAIMRETGQVYSSDIMNKW